MVSQTAGGEARPVACTLKRSEQNERVDQWRELCRDALIEESRGETVSTTVWECRPGVVERLEHLIEAERACCSFLNFEVEREASTIRLRTTFPPEARSLLDLVFG